MSPAIAKPGIVRLDAEGIGALRHSVYLRAKGRCEECGRRIAEHPSGGWNTMHLSHVKGRGAGGEDTAENTFALCIDCHLVQIHNPRSVPAKA